VGQRNKLYSNFFNPFLIKPSRALPEEMAVLGAGTIGPDIAYYLKDGLPEKNSFWWMWLMPRLSAYLMKSAEKWARFLLKRKG
jgi:hypothetical protein